MKPTDPKTLEPIYNEGGIVGRKMTIHPNFEIIYMTLEAGADLKPHKTPFDSEFFAYKGEAVFIVGEEEIRTKEGNIIKCDGEIPHGIRNDSNEQITVLVIKKFK